MPFEGVVVGVPVVVVEVLDVLLVELEVVIVVPEPVPGLIVSQ